MNYKNNNIKLSKSQYMHLSKSERLKIQQLYRQKFSINAIAKFTSRSPSTILRELKRNGKRNQPAMHNRRCQHNTFYYAAKQAQTRRDERFYRPKTQNKFAHFLKTFKQKFAVDDTLEVFRMQYIKDFPSSPAPCLKTLYNWEAKKIVSFRYGDKIVKKKNKSSRTSTHVANKKNIKQRIIDFGFDHTVYSDPGHYEIDTIYNGDKKGGLLTLNERFTRKFYAVKIADRKAITINRILRNLITQIGAHNIKSITSDNGTEFAYSAVIEASYNLRWYYCDPYSSWQRGQNERLNRDVRRYYQKGTYFTKLSTNIIEKMVKKINNRPRRIFDGLSANEYSIQVKRKCHNSMS